MRLEPRCTEKPVRTSGSWCSRRSTGKPEVVCSAGRRQAARAAATLPHSSDPVKLRLNSCDFIVASVRGAAMEQPSMGPARHPDAELLDFLAAHGLSDLSSTLSSATLRGCAARNAASRPAFLKRLQGLGVDKLSKRQAFANALGKATRDGTLPKLSTAEVLLALGEDEAILWSEKTGEVEALLAPYDVSAQPPAPAASAQRIPRVIHYTNKTRRVGARAWRNICKTFELNPHYSFSYYDDARCEALIREHFHASVLIAFQSLRQGAAKADLWRYCCLYIQNNICGRK